MKFLVVVIGFITLISSFNIKAEVKNAVMLIKFLCVESDGSGTAGRVVLYNETTDDRFVIRDWLSLTPSVKKIDIPAGTYRLHNYRTYNGVKFDLSDSGYRFKIVEDQINYVGDWLFTEKWDEFMSKGGKFSVSFATSFSKNTLEEAVSKYPEVFSKMEFNVSEAIASH